MSIMTVRAPEDLREKLSCYSHEIGITRNALVLMILNAWIEQKEEKRYGDEVQYERSGRREDKRNFGGRFANSDHGKPAGARTGTGWICSGGTGEKPAAIHRSEKSSVEKV